MFEDALAKYGYWVLFVGSGVEGDAVLGTAAFLAHQGKLDPWWTLLVAIAGSTVAGEISFRVGRRQGAGWVDKRAAGNPRMKLVRRWLSERARLLVFASRFLWGFRLSIPALCGASGMTQASFSVWNFAGAFVWASVVWAGAYFFGMAIEQLWEDYSGHLRLVAGVLFAFLFSIYLWRRRDRMAGGAMWKAICKKLGIGKYSPTRQYTVDSSRIGPDARKSSPEAAPRGAYEFSPGKDWFSANVPVWTAAMAPWRDRPEVRYLEIGSAEGRSMVWMLENILTHSTSRALSMDLFYGRGGLVEWEGERLSRFHANMRRSGRAERVQAIEGPSQVELRKLPLVEPFDLIYVDGNHRATGVLEDLVLSWRLLAPGGLLVADDYEWAPERALSERPQMAIDLFVRVFGEELEVVHRRYQVILRKVSAEVLETLVED